MNAKQSGPSAVTVEGNPTVQVQNSAADPLHVREVAAPLQTVMTELGFFKAASSPSTLSVAISGYLIDAN